MSATIRVLALHAHPDDVEFQCAGTLILLREAGCAVTIATMTPGDCGSAEHDCRGDQPDSSRGSAARRPRSSGQTIFAWNSATWRSSTMMNRRRRVTEALRRARPDLILTAPPVDYIVDHEMTSVLVRDACFALDCPNYTTRQWEPALHSPRSRTSTSWIRSRAVTARASRSRPISTSISLASFPIKREMLTCHASQRNWLLRQHGIDEYLEVQAKWSAHRGAEIGVAQAEGFRQYRGHPYPQDNPLLELIGQDGRGKRLTATASADRT